MTTHANRWQYQAADAKGTLVRGEIDAPTERDAIDALRRRTLWVVALSPIASRVRTSHTTADTSTPAGRGADAPMRTRDRTFNTRNSDVDLAVTMRTMSTLLGAGVPLARTLTYAAQEAATPALRLAFARVSDAVQSGETLSAAVGKQRTPKHAVFPAEFAPLIAAGEHSGTLDKSLALLATHLEQRDALRSKIRSALVYPLLLAFASIAGIIVILVVVVPRFATLIADSGGTLPLSTRMLMAMSSAVTHGWWIAAIVIVVSLVFGERHFRSERVRRGWHARILRVPILGHFERLRAAVGYTGTLAVALQSGVSLLGAMSLARAIVSNRALSADLAIAEDRVRGGSTLATAISGLLPSLTERLLDAGEVSGDIPGMATRASTAADTELQRTLMQLVSLIEPVMILGFGGIVGFVALALLQAIYGLNANVL